MFLVGHTATAPLWPASDLSGHLGTHMPMDKDVASCNWGGGGACIARGGVTPPPHTHTDSFLTTLQPMHRECLDVLYVCYR